VPIRVGEPLSLEDVVEAALGAEVELGSAASGRIGAARDVIERAVSSNETVYGVTTGFGAVLSVRPVAGSLAAAAPVLGTTSLAFGLWYALGALQVAPYYF